MRADNPSLVDQGVARLWPCLVCVNAAYRSIACTLDCLIGWQFDCMYSLRAAVLHAYGAIARFPGA